MNYVEQMQTLSKEDMNKVIFDALNNKAMVALDVVEESFKGRKEDFLDRAGIAQVNLGDKIHDMKTSFKAKLKDTTDKFKKFTSQVSTKEEK